MVSHGKFNWDNFAGEVAAAGRDRKRLARRRGVRESLVPNQAVVHFTDAIKAGEIKVDDYSLAKCFESCVPDGRTILSSWRGSQAGNPQGHQLVQEAVDTSAFANVNQTFMSQIMYEAFNNPTLIGDQLVRKVTSNQEWERIIGIGNLGDVAQVVGEGEDYPRAQMAEDWIETPQTEKRGFIVDVTKEAIFFDRTGQLVQRATEVAWSMAVNKEKRILDMVVGITARFNRKGRGWVTAYGDNSGAHDWDNQSSNALVDWESIDAADQIFNAITDPHTGEPIEIGGKTLLVPQALKKTAERIINATEVTMGTGAVTDVGYGTETGGRNPVSGDGLRVMSNQYVKTRSGSDTTWFYGDFPGAFIYVENWGPTAQQAPVNSDDEFKRDIVLSTKMSERGKEAATNPRKVQKCTG